jgi:hypothetical protein
MAEPALASGTTGRIVITSASNKELAVGTYTLERSATLADVNNSLSGGWDKSKRIRRGGKLTATVMWDALVTPEDATVDAGDEFICDLYVGESGKYYHLCPMICESVSLVGCSQDNVVTYNLSARVNGALPDPTNAP